MDQMPPSQPPPPPHPAPPEHAGLPQPMHPPRPTVVQIVAKPGGLWRAVTIVIGLMLFMIVFFVGLGFGAFSVMLYPSAENFILHQTYRAGRGGPIAIIPIYDIIDSGQAEFMRMATDDILNRGKFRAVILRVDSPGGGVTASDQIWSEVERLRKSGLPVVASYGSIAASGGYYISCSADHIFAEETTTTGSIGVIAQIFTFEALADKIGVEPVTLVATGSPEKDVANDLFRTWNENDRQKIRVMLDSAYDIFTQRVRDGRSDSIGDEAKLAQLADGSIFTATQALENGLIDAIGYLDDAIVKAESLASITKGTADIVILKQPRSLFATGLFTQTRRPASALDASTIRRLANDLGSPRVMYLMH